MGHVYQKDPSGMCDTSAKSSNPAYVPLLPKEFMQYIDHFYQKDQCSVCATSTKGTHPAYVPRLQEDPSGC